MLQLSHTPAFLKDHSFLFFRTFKEIILKPHVFLLLPLFDSQSGACYKDHVTVNESQ